MKRIVYILLILLSLHCKEKYDVYVDFPNQGLLVVEGYVNGNGKTSITLSRTTQLSKKEIVRVPRAVLRIEGENNDTRYLYETDEGSYVTDSQYLDPAQKYRLRIFIDGNNEYVSDFRSIVQTPAVDSLTFQYNNGIVDFYAHSQNDPAEQIFYKWDYDETWEFKSSFHSKLQYKITGVGNNRTFELEWYDPINHGYNDSIYTCWKTNKSTGIILGSAADLAKQDINLPVRTMRRNAFELSFFYSILVKQYGLRADSYEFFRRMRKNSESLGTIFDAQPSELVGNLSSVSNPGEQVIGFVEFCTVSEKRLFVDCTRIPGDPYDPDCPFWEEVDPTFPEYPYENDPDVLIQVYYHRGLVPTVPEYTDPATGNVLTFYAERPLCVDCRMRGTNTKPEFWP